MKSGLGVARRKTRGANGVFNGWAMKRKRGSVGQPVYLPHEESFRQQKLFFLLPARVMQRDLLYQHAGTIKHQCHTENRKTRCGQKLHGSAPKTVPP
jgi:hypothetical protein